MNQKALETLLTDPTIKQTLAIIEDLQAGLSLREVAKKQGLTSNTTVVRIRDKYNLGTK
ncbi:helix-turn-helix domain-containing protein [Psychromonas sp. Urea-02u-13]|uniref:helix-turn-helix domain-containing protein n=1 Tax=Psychromonas sp. Urea-02u-13 TaxID=2058326 RepID=UPI0012FF34F2|nr:helix-turn-helix domain containing protein [Psychromonas sp. Urea-02u-13]